MSVVLVRIACVPFSLAGDFVFEANGVVFTLSVGDRLCFNVTVNNDDENELDETLYFYLYQPNNLFTDKTRIVIRDNEEGGFDTDVRIKSNAVAPVLYLESLLETIIILNNFHHILFVCYSC